MSGRTEGKSNPSLQRAVGVESAEDKGLDTALLSSPSSESRSSGTDVDGSLERGVDEASTGATTVIGANWQGLACSSTDPLVGVASLCVHSEG